MEMFYLILASIQIFSLVIFILKYRKEITDIENVVYLKKIEVSLLSPFIYLVSRYDMSFFASNKVKLSIKKLYGEKYFNYYHFIFLSKKICNIYFSIFFSLIFLSFYKEFILIPLIILSIIILNFYMDQNQVNKYIIYTKKINEELSNFITRLNLLLNAGIGIRQSIEYIVKNNENELSDIFKEIIENTENGMSEDLSYSKALSKNDDLIFRKLITIILQNIRYGGDDIYSTLSHLNKEASEYKKKDFISRSQKVNQKLLIPNFIIFVVIMIMVMMPILVNIT